MLMKCPECELQVSDKAITCPHCGYPMKQNITIQTKPVNRKRRLPNGFGQISKLNNRRLRKPYRAMITVGKTNVGKPIQKILKPEGYFSTYNEAYEALVEYHKNPYEIEKDIKMYELYEKWSTEYFKTLKSPSSCRTITAAWAYCSEIYNVPICSIRSRHLKGCIDNATAEINGNMKNASAGTKSRIKSMFNLMFDYALEYELVDKNYARIFNLSTDIVDEKERAKRAHMPFTESEINKLWENINNVPYVDVVLIQCYSGWRPQELGLIKLENINFEEGYIVGGMKTKAGTNRVVPIHSKILPLIKQKYKEAEELESEYLINCTDTNTSRSSLNMTYDKYQKRFIKIKERLGLNPDHRAHDGRMHFITQAKKNGVDEYAIKYIVGHSINDITEKIYTKRNVDWLKTEIEKIK